MRHAPARRPDADAQVGSLFQTGRDADDDDGETDASPRGRISNKSASLALRLFFPLPEHQLTFSFGATPEHRQRFLDAPVE
jgi:hypothetical protein